MITKGKFKDGTTGWKAVQDMCDVCKKRHEYHTEIVRLGSANGGIMKTIKRLTK